MEAVGFAALAANAASFGLLWGFREGDANVRSAWICTRNDVLGNLAVLFTAAGVFGTGIGWPDVVVAAIMAGLALQGATTVIRQSLGELRQPTVVPAEVQLAPALRETTQFVWRVTQQADLSTFQRRRFRAGRSAAHDLGINVGRVDFKAGTPKISWQPLLDKT
jgi:Co/Zn/Cd efflux system component